MNRGGTFIRAHPAATIASHNNREGDEDTNDTSNSHNSRGAAAAKRPSEHNKL